jgi:molecular chaperone GrpE (heat shock protein)
MDTDKPSPVGTVTADPAATHPAVTPPGSTAPDPAVPNTAAWEGCMLPGADLSARLGAVEEQLQGFNRRATHREQIIDRLHEENQSLRQGEHRIVLEPVIADLIRLHDQLAREARRDPDGVLPSFVAEVAEILDRCGIEVFEAQPREAYRTDRHRPLAVVPTTDPELHNTVAEPIAAGFLDRHAGRIRRPAQARFHQYHEDQET